MLQINKSPFDVGTISKLTVDSQLLQIFFSPANFFILLMTKLGRGIRSLYTLPYKLQSFVQIHVTFLATGAQRIRIQTFKTIYT